MTKQVTVPVIPGTDLAFRPRTYFGPIPAETHVLAHVTGHERREFIRAQLAADGDDPMLDQLASLFASDRETLGRLHPMLMGGEYLPPFLDDETEIARISLASTTADQISVRAQKLADGIAYRIVDEYGDMVDYVCQPAHSELPLTLGQLVSHPSFGEGIVVSAEGSGAHMRIQVNFASSGSKWLVYAYANLTPL